MSLDLRIQVNNLLLSAPALQIYFVCETIIVSPSSLERVRNALLQGKVDVAVVGDDPSIAGLLYGRGFRPLYRTDLDTLFLPYRGHIHESGNWPRIFGECVHVMGDVDGASWRSYTETEAAARIATLLFYKYSTRRPAYIEGETALPSNVVAGKIADSIGNVQGKAVDPKDVMALRQLISREQGKKIDRPAHNDGVG
jgi:hypothetical protein